VPPVGGNLQSGLLALLALVFVIGVLEMVALRFHLYWTTPWFDIMMHFLGGVWVAFAALWALLFVWRHAENLPNRFSVYVVPFGATLVVGVLWEVFEYLFGIAIFGNDAYAVDTALDMGMDLFGALSVSTLYAFSIKKTPLPN
jgi:hypothetical protein